MSIKSFLKKACILGVSAVMIFGLGINSMATPPNGNIVGKLYTDYATIGGDMEATLVPVVITQKGLYYDPENPQPQVLINTGSNENGTDGGIAVKSVKSDAEINLKKGSDDGTGVALYLRAVKHGDNPNENINWICVWRGGKTIYNLQDTTTYQDIPGYGTSQITGTDVGRYDIYYYIDGNGLYPDSGTN